MRGLLPPQQIVRVTAFLASTSTPTSRSSTGAQCGPAASRQLLIATGLKRQGRGKTVPRARRPLRRFRCTLAEAAASTVTFNTK